MVRFYSASNEIVKLAESNLQKKKKEYKCVFFRLQVRGKSLILLLKIIRYTVFLFNILFVLILLHRLMYQYLHIERSQSLDLTEACCVCSRVRWQTSHVLSLPDQA